MAFQKEPRYHVLRVHEATARELFLADAKGTITQRTGALAKPWTDGEPAQFTLHQAARMVDALNAQLPQAVLNNIKADYYPRTRKWHYEPVKA